MRYYKMGLWAEDCFDTYIQMTQEEALIVNRVLCELEDKYSDSDFSYCGSCSVIIDDYIEKEVD